MLLREYDGAPRFMPKNQRGEGIRLGRNRVGGQFK